MRKPIKGFENYQIDEFGNVFNSNGDQLASYITDSGYFRIEINDKHKYIHKLIAETYIDNPLNKPQVNHIDGNKFNNYYINLEWVTNRENMLHAVANKLTSYNLPLAAIYGANNKPKAIEQCDLNGNAIREFKSVSEARKLTGIQMKGALAGRYKTACGFVWRYKSYETI